jgi:soluble lytic murein transglycosylase-like protein
MSLLANSSENLADSLSSTSHQKKQFHAYPKEKNSNNAIDVWERIRLGMKIPNPIATQQLTESVLIPEKNSYTPKFALRPKISEPGKLLDESTLSARPATSKYIGTQSTAHTPINKYTALGLKLKFGTKSNSVQNDSCTGLKPQLHKHIYSATPVYNNLQNTSNNNDPLTKAENNSVPCIKTTNLPAIRVASKQVEQSRIEEKNNAKKALINERINKQIAFFSQSPGYLFQVSERARPYLYHIVEGLSSNQLPLELALLPIVESGYQPTAFSPKGAAGLWQFIPSTGNDYDLKQSIHYDDRLDILASTRAAMRFLSDLKSHFNGDWLLALAAYNCGQGSVDNAISRNLADGLETDYWSLRLPEETQDYVPRLLALASIFAKPENYGLKFTPIKNEPYFVKVKINRKIDITYLADKKFVMIAKLANLSHDQFNRLNPGYLNPVLSTDATYTFLLPHSNAEQLHRLLTSIGQFMAEPVSLAMNNKHNEINDFPYAWNLPQNSSISKLTESSWLSKEIY